jgi:hypothetical protein
MSSAPLKSAPLSAPPMSSGPMSAGAAAPAYGGAPPLNGTSQFGGAPLSHSVIKILS